MSRAWSILPFTPKARYVEVEEVNSAAQGRGRKWPAQGHSRICRTEPLVSIDFLGTSAASSSVDSLETAVIEGKLVRVLSWYDNEWGFSNRMVDTAAAMAKLG